MNAFLHHLFATAILPLLAATAVGQDSLILTDHHHVLRGKVVSSTPESVTFEHRIGTRADTQTYSSTSIDPHCFYVIRDRAVADDAAGKVQLGRYCEAHKLFTRALIQFGEAQQLDASLDVKREIATCEEGCGHEMLVDAQQLAAAGKPDVALARATAIVRDFRNTPAAADARKLITSIDASMVATRSERVEERDDKQESARLKEVRGTLRRAADRNIKGLQAEDLGAAERNFKESVTEYDRALHELASEVEEHPNDTKVTTEVEPLLAQTRQATIAVHVNLGSVYMSQTNYDHAMREANAALALDPDNSAVKSFRARVASASSRNGILVYPLQH